MTNEKADKYRWHDLRKDPTDLPKTLVPIIVMYSNKSYDIGVRPAIKLGTAWKYFEPFEVEE